MPPLLEVEDLVVDFGPVRAVDGVSFRLPEGPYGLALVGESGSGKTTTARALLRLLAPTSGAIRLGGEDVSKARGSARRRYRRAIQIVFQDPATTLAPRVRVGRAIAEALATHRVVPRDRVAGRVGELLEEVGLEPSMAERYPHQLS